MSTPDEQAFAIKKVFEKREKVTAPDLQVLRENSELLEGHDRKADFYLFRMQVELIDVIRGLHETSAKLVSKTNLLTGVILAFTVALFFIGIVQIVIMVRHP